MATIAVVETECTNEDCTRQGRCKAHPKSGGESFQPKLSVCHRHTKDGGVELVVDCQSFN